MAKKQVFKMSKREQSKQLVRELEWATAMRTLSSRCLKSDPSDRMHQHYKRWCYEVRQLKVQLLEGV